MRATPKGLIELSIAAAFALVVAAAAATAVRLDEIVPQSGFFAGLIRPIGWAFVFAWIGVILGGSYALLSWIILGGWAHTEHLIQLRMRRGRPIKVGTCHQMHARYVMHEVTELVSAIRTGAAS